MHVAQGEQACSKAAFPRTLLPCCPGPGLATQVFEWSEAVEKEGEGEGAAKDGAAAAPEGQQASTEAKKTK